MLALLRHKNSQAEREYKRIQLQMATLENSVRSECKQAFAELQTDLTDLDKDIQLSGIPILHNTRYLEKIFFPGVPNTNVFQLIKVSDTFGFGSLLRRFGISARRGLSQTWPL